MKAIRIAVVVMLAGSLFISSPVLAQKKKGNVVEQGEDQVKLFTARQDFLRGDFLKALNLYKEVLKNKPTDADVNYRVGECFLAMEMYEDALEHLEKAKELDPKANAEMNYSLGRAYQGMDKLDKAIEAYTTFKTENEGKAKEYEVDALVNQCKTAQELISKPVAVVVNNAGDFINSSFDDKGPSITADGKTLVFTSRRPAGGKTKTKIDKEGDFKNFEDIYMSKWDDMKSSWTEAEMVKGSLNTEGHDACTSISPDGKLIFVYRNIEGETKSGDIYYSKVMTSGKWGAPKAYTKPVNSTYYEDGACISSDGSKLFFISERPGTSEQKGQGMGDIWMCKKITKTEWGPPVNLGPEVNTPDDENGLFLHPDGKTLFFCSTGHNSMGSYDIFMTVFENGKWSKPKNLGYPINSTRMETKFVLSTDNNTAYIASNRAGGQGERDIYMIDMSKYDLMGVKVDPTKGPILSILKGTIFNDAGQGTENAKVVITDKASGAVVGETYSQEDGSYFFTILGNKTYTIEVSKEGLETKKEEFLLKEGKKETYTEVKHVILSKPKKK